RIAALRGNISETGFILGSGAGAKGVDADESDMGADPGAVALKLARKLGCTVAVTGALDAVSDGARTVRVENGHSALSRVTGTGCMCSSLVGAFCGASPERVFEAAASAVSCMGIAGEIAFERAGGHGTGGFRVAIIDSLSNMTSRTIKESAKIYEA
ncbi:MAG: hydroxyethylthiazole kinase, partial [Synergistaceae bacterium]|nr:hydroxyethylthiazole kinase [Synergistaceae bacterium]